MGKKKLTRSDYQQMIMPRRKGDRRKRSNATNGGVNLPDLMLTQLIGKDNKNVRQRNALIDTMNNSQMRRIGLIVRSFLRSRYQLSPSQIKQLSKNQDFVTALISPKVPLDTRKKILKQKGGIFGALLPLAAKIIGPAILGPLASKIFK